jgi:hypothetical protein
MKKALKRALGEQPGENSHLSFWRRARDAEI